MDNGISLCYETVKIDKHNRTELQNIIE